MIKIKTSWNKRINISCDIFEVEKYLKNRGIIMGNYVEYSKKNNAGFIYTRESFPQLSEDIVWINPSGFSDPIDFLDTIGHEFRHSKYPEKSEEEILDSDEFPITNKSYPKIMQELWEQYHQEN